MLDTSIEGLFEIQGIGFTGVIVIYITDRQMTNFVLQVLYWIWRDSYTRGTTTTMSLQKQNRSTKMIFLILEVGRYGPKAIITRPKHDIHPLIFTMMIAGYYHTMK